MSRKADYVDPETGQEYRVGGCLISDTPSTLPLFGAPPNLINNLPPSVDLRQFMTPVEHQGNTNSCVPNAVAGAYEYLIKKNKGLHVDVSRLFIYYNGRLKMGQSEYSISDSGCYVHSAVQAAKEWGCCKEDMFPFSSQNLNRKPPKHCYEEAKKHRVTEARSVPIDLMSMKACLADGYPFVFGIFTYQSFHAAANNGGRVAMPNLAQESINQNHGAHAMLAVGYSDNSRCFIIRNSWGPNWGDRGYCYFPYQYLSHPKLCSDAHVIRALSNDNLQRPIANNETAPVVPWHNYANNYYISPNQAFRFYPNQYFWMPFDNFNYMSAIWRDGRLESSESDELNLDGSVVLWMDVQDEAHSQVETELKKSKNVTFIYREKFSDGETYLVENKHKIKENKFQIICHGLYKDEKKDPLDLLSLLSYLGFSDIPVLVFTSNKVNLMESLKVSSKRQPIQRWQERLFITETAVDLLNQLISNCTNNVSSTAGSRNS